MFSVPEYLEVHFNTLKITLKDFVRIIINNVIGKYCNLLTSIQRDRGTISLYSA